MSAIFYFDIVNIISSSVRIHSMLRVIPNHIIFCGHNSYLSILKAYLQLKDACTYSNKYEWMCFHFAVISTSCLSFFFNIDSTITVLNPITKEVSQILLLLLFYLHKSCDFQLQNFSRDFHFQHRIRCGPTFITRTKSVVPLGSSRPQVSCKF